MASPCDNRLTVNIKKLPVINDINNGDFIIVETPEGTNILDFRNFLITLDNTTFAPTFLNYNTRINTISANLSLSAADLYTTTSTHTENILTLNNQVTSLSASVSIINNSSPTNANIRISLDSNTGTPTSSISGDTLYIHPYKGNSISLFDTSLMQWVGYTIDKFGQELVDTTSSQQKVLPKDTNYDVYLQYINDEFQISFDPWQQSTVGIIGYQNRTYRDGVCVHKQDHKKRLIGCIRTTIDGYSEQTFGGNGIGGTAPKQFVWNAQNQIPISCTSWETGTYTAVNPTGQSNTGWRKVNPSINSGLNNRFSFIIGDITHVDMVGQVYANSTSAAVIGAYTSFTVNTEDNTPNILELNIPEFAGTNVTPTAHLKKAFQPGYHFCQMVEKYFCTVTVQINEGLSNQTGFMASIYL